MKLGPGVHLIHARIAQAILVEGPPLTLIDTGAAGSVPRIAREVRRAGRRLEDIEQIVITHAHADHIGSAAELRELTGARVLVHPADGDVACGRRPPYPISSRGVVGAILSPATVLLQHRTAFPPVVVDGLLQDGQELAPGIQMIATPGHTPGHVSVLVPEAELLHVGDVIHNLAGTWPPPAMLNEDELGIYLAIRKLAATSFRRLSFGHGPPVFRGARRRVERAARRYRVGAG